MSPRFTTVTTAVSAAYAQLRLDQDMLALLKEYEALKPAVLDRRCEPATARIRPVMADAVRILQRRRGVAAPGDDPAVHSRDISMEMGGGTLPARVYVPAGDGPFPLVV